MEDEQNPAPGTPETNDERCSAPLGDWLRSLTPRPRLIIDMQPIHDEVDRLTWGLEATGAPVTIAKRYAANLLRCPAMAVHERMHPPEGTEEYLVEGRLAEYGFRLHLSGKSMEAQDTFIRTVTAYAAALGDECPPADAQVWEFAHDTVCRFAAAAGAGPWPGPLVFQEDIIGVLGTASDRPVVVLRGRTDLSVGGRGATAFVRAVCEFKSGRTPEDIFDDLGWYTALVSVRDGFAPTHTALWSRGEPGQRPTGVLTVLSVDERLVRDAFERMLDVIEAACDVERGNVAAIPGTWCRFCPLRDTCTASTSRTEQP